MEDGEVVFGEEVEVGGLAVGKGGLGEDGFDGGVVAVDDEGAVVEVVAPKFEGLDEAEEFLVIGGVGLLGVLVFGGVVGDNTFIGTFPLGEDGTGGGGGGVGVEVEGGAVGEKSGAARMGAEARADWRVLKAVWASAGQGIFQFVLDLRRR